MHASKRRRKYHLKNIDEKIKEKKNKRKKKKN